ncbi:hypothetical protein H633G_02633 [Metarhizium anisopliae BRIP 53284]|nr:hypothetical protein H633G_02633 [Metarhizium anisopliae BRIP 53284]
MASDIFSPGSSQRPDRQQGLSGCIVLFPSTSLLICTTSGRGFVGWFCSLESRENQRSTGSHAEENSQRWAEKKHGEDGCKSPFETITQKCRTPKTTTDLPLGRFVIVFT